MIPLVAFIVALVVLCVVALFRVRWLRRHLARP